MSDKKYCIGCEDNFYNGNNPYGVKECWSLKTAKVKTRFRLSIHTPMNQKSGYVKRKTHSCFHEKGYVHLSEIPDYAK